MYVREKESNYLNKSPLAIRANTRFGKKGARQTVSAKIRTNLNDDCSK